MLTVAVSNKCVRKNQHACCKSVLGMPCGHCIINDTRGCPLLCGTSYDCGALQERCRQNSCLVTVFKRKLFFSQRELLAVASPASKAPESLQERNPALLRAVHVRFALLLMCAPPPLRAEGEPVQASCSHMEARSPPSQPTNGRTVSKTAKECSAQPALAGAMSVPCSQQQGFQWQVRANKNVGHRIKGKQSLSVEMSSSLFFLAASMHQTGAFQWTACLLWLV